MREQQVILLNEGGLDSDTSDRFKAPGNSDHILNDIVSFEGNQGSRVSIKGNKLILNLDNEFTAIGWVEDIERNAIIVFLHHSSNNHGIISINMSTLAITNVLTSQSVLNFSLSHRINHANVIGELLYWTDGFNQPRKINITKAIAFTNSQSGGYSAITEETISAAKVPPPFPVQLTGTVNSSTLGYFDNSNLIGNFLRGYQFQFAYRWIYDDNEKSNFSPLSKVAIPILDEDVNAKFATSNIKNNSIRIAFNTGSELVEEIELAVKIGNLGSWNIIETFNKEQLSISNDSKHLYVFNNDNFGTPIDNTVVLTSNNVSPQLAEVQEFLPSNEIVYGGNTEGFNNIDTNIDVDIVTNIGNSALTFQRNNIVSFFNDVHMLYIPISVPVDSSVAVLTLNYPNGTNQTITVSSAPASGVTREQATRNRFFQEFQNLNICDGDGLVTVNNTSISSFNVLSGSVDAVGNPFGTNPIISDGEHLFFLNYFYELEAFGNNVVDISGDLPILNPIFRYVDQVNLYYFTDVPDYVTPIPSFGSGLYKLGVVYEDDYGRTSFVQRSDGDSVFIDEKELFPNEDNEDITVNVPIHIDMKVKHRPPSWAKYWRPVITRNLSENILVQWIIDYAYQDIGDNPRMFFSFSNSLNNSRSSTNAIGYPGYIYERGDYVRVKGTLDGTEIIYDNTREYVLNGIFTTSDDTYQNVFVYNDIEAEFISGERVVPISIPYFSLLEIVRPISNIDQNFYFPIGETYEIGNPGQSNAYHKAIGDNNSHLSPQPNQDQSESDPVNTPAIVRIDVGDRFNRLRFDNYRKIPFYINSPSLSDIYVSDFKSYGKPYVENIDSEQRYFNILRHSGKYFDNTFINDLNSFQSSNYVQIDDSFGRIRKTVQVGDALKVYQDKKSTSIYIGKSFIKQGDGTDQVMTVDRTFGVVNPSFTDFGCVFPESVLRNERYVYFYDIHSGTFIRDAANGLEPISMNLMDNYFKRKSQALLTSGLSNVRVVTGYDYENNLVYVTFIDSANSANNETLAFHEPSNRWISYFSFIPTMYADASNRTFTFNGGDIYIQNDDTVNRTTFFGTKYPREYRVYANAQFNMPKIFFNLSIHTNKNGWSVSEATIDPGPNYPRGMKSRIKSNLFTEQDGVLHAAFRRNLLTTSSTESTDDLINGDQLRGEAMAITLHEENNTETKLHEVDIIFSKA